MIYLDRSICNDNRAALSMEWVSPNGRGGYAASTVAGACTRREHGLLVAATSPPHGQVVFLAGIEERLLLDKTTIPLSCLAADEVETAGVLKHLRSFAWEKGSTVHEYEAAGLRLKRRISIIHGLDAVILSYELSEVPPNLRRRPVLMEVRPWIAYLPLDDFELDHDEGLDLSPYLIDDKLRVDPRPVLPPLFFTHESDVFLHDPKYLEHLPLPTGAPSGSVPEALLGSPGAFMYQLSLDRQARLAASVREPLESLGRAQVLYERKKKTSLAVRRRITAGGPLTRALMESVKDFIISGERGRRWISAGYPGGGKAWEDALLALPGMLIHSNLNDVAREVLLCAARTMCRGRLPFSQADDPPEFPESERAGIGATLRFMDTCRLYLKKTGDVRTTRKRLYPVCRDSLAHILSGAPGTRVGPEGLLETEPETNLCSRQAGVSQEGMDSHKALLVSHNALWYKALSAVRDMAIEFNDRGTAREADEIIQRFREWFPRVFWNPERNCLYRAICGGVPDATITPYQVLALVVSPAIVDREKTISILNVLERDLLTPRGLRTLSPGEPGYVGLECLLYSEYPDLRHRGSAYPWLLGPFAEAYLSINGFSSEAKARIAAMVGEFRSHLREGALGHVAERFDGDVPHAPRGLPASAASASELLRICLEFLGGEV